MAENGFTSITIEPKDESKSFIKDWVRIQPPRLHRLCSNRERVRDTERQGKCEGCRDYLDSFYFIGSEIFSIILRLVH